MIEKEGETDYFKASDFIKAFVFYLGNPKRLNFLIANDKKFGREIVKVYEGEKKRAIILDEALTKKTAPNVRIIKGNFGEYLKAVHLLRHNSENLALAILRSG